jgi:TetR/AcrR family transcriptional repressor of nem operon
MGADTRDNLVRTARNLIHGSSFADVSVDEVCRVAGVNKGSLYHFFPSKEALGAAVLEENWTMMVGLLDRAFQPDVEPLDRIDRFLVEFQTMLIGMQDRLGHTPGCPVGNLAVEFSAQDPKMRKRIAAILDDWADYFSEAITEAQASGAVPEAVDPGEVAASLVAYIQGLAALAKAYNDPTMMTKLGAGARRLVTESS